MKTDTFPDLSSVCALDNCHIKVTYVTGEKRLFDVRPYANGPWYGELADPGYFARVSIDPQLKDTVSWPHGQDLAPHEIYELGIPVDE